MPIAVECFLALAACYPPKRNGSYDSPAAEVDGFGFGYGWLHSQEQFAFVRAADGPWMLGRVGVRFGQIFCCYNIC